MNNDFSVLLYGFEEKKKENLQKLFSAGFNQEIKIINAHNGSLEQILNAQAINLLISYPSADAVLEDFITTSTRINPLIPLMVYHDQPLNENELQAINKRQDNIILINREKDLLKAMSSLIKKRPKGSIEDVKDRDAEKALEVIGDVVWDWDINRDTVKFDDSIHKLLSIPDKEIDLQGKMARIHGEDRIHVQTRIKKHLSGETQMFESEYRIKKGHEKYIWVLDRGKVIQWSDDGMPGRAVGTLSDITFRKKYEDSLRNAKLSAEESGRLKSFYLSSMHEKISSPASTVMGYAEAITDELMSPEQRAVLSKKIMDSTENMIQSVNDILDISKIDTGNVNPHFSSQKLNKILHDVLVATQQKLAKYNRTNVRVVLDDGKEDFSLSTDHSLLRQALMHVADNAVKFTPEGEVHLGFELCGEKTICIYVRDSGIGMDKPNIEKIFNKFKRLPNAKGINYPGNGLGLSIASGFIHKLGGDIKVESSYGNGSEFIINLPFFGGEGQIQIQQKEEARIDWSQYHILMVEDDNVSASLIKTQLESTRVELTILNNPIIAINQVKEGRVPDLILMDIQLPGISGLEATKIIKANNPDVPIIAQTAFTMQSDKKKSLEAGCSDYMSKPIEKKKLIELLSKYLQ